VVRVIRPFDTNQDLLSHLKFDSGRSIVKTAIVILLVNLFVINVRSDLRGCGHTGHSMNYYD